MRNFSDMTAKEEFFSRMSEATKKELHDMFEEFVYKHATCTACAVDAQGRSSQNYLSDELRQRIVDAEMESYRALYLKRHAEDFGA